MCIYSKRDTDEGDDFIAVNRIFRSSEDVTIDHCCRDLLTFETEVNEQ